MLANTLKALLLLCLIQAARTVADPVKGRAPGSSEQPHRSGERKHGRSAPLNASPLAVGDDVAIGIVARMGRDEHPWLAWFASE